MEPLRDRRAAPRGPLARPCKAYHRPSRRFAPGETCNLSERGALLTLQTGRPWEAGDPIEVVVSWTTRPVLLADAMVHARIVRAGPMIGDRQTVAIEFDAPVALQAAA